jgi:4-amino-4-deoxy-L-arabinose transferase-like glycosyltransferase
MTSDIPPPCPPTSRAAWAAVAVVLACTAVVRVRLLDVPLERDEGEYAYAGQLLLQGVPPYQAAYNMKFPGTYAAYAVLMAAFGETVRGVHLGLLAVNAVTIVLVFLLGRRLFGPAAGAAAAACYALLAVGPGVFGFAAHATHFVNLFAAAGAVALLAAADDRRPRAYFAAGLLFGAAVLMKQHGAAFAAFGLAYAVRREWYAGRPALVARAGAFAAGVVLPFAACCAALAAAGVFDKFWFWTVAYAREYAAEIPPEVGWEILKITGPKAVGPALPVWAVAAAGLVAAWRRCPRPAAGFATGFLAAGALSVCPGFYFREHYFVAMFPAVAVLAGEVVTLGPPAARPWPGLAAVAAAVGWSAWAQFDYLARTPPVEVCRRAYGGNPFAEAAEVADRVRADTTPADAVAVLGSEPQVYFLAGRRSATGYIYTYPLMEPQPFARVMQREMVAEVEAARPKYLVWAVPEVSWGFSEGSPRDVFRWGLEYRKAKYTLVGVVGADGAGTRSRWGELPDDYPFDQSARFAVYRRRD